MRKFYIIIALIVITSPGFAQLDSLKTLGEVVVTGQYKPQSLKNSVYQVRVISKDKIQKTAASRLPISAWPAPLASTRSRRRER